MFYLTHITVVVERNTNAERLVVGDAPSPQPTKREAVMPRGKLAGLIAIGYDWGILGALHCSIRYGVNRNASMKRIEDDKDLGVSECG